MGARTFKKSEKIKNKLAHYPHLQSALGNALSALLLLRRQTWTWQASASMSFLQTNFLIKIPKGNTKVNECEAVNSNTVTPLKMYIYAGCASLACFLISIGTSIISPLASEQMACSHWPKPWERSADWMRPNDDSDQSDDPVWPQGRASLTNADWPRT